MNGNSENESLWKEVSELRAKHAQQQQVIRKVSVFLYHLNLMSIIFDPQKTLCWIVSDWS